MWEGSLLPKDFTWGHHLVKIKTWGCAGVTWKNMGNTTEQPKCQGVNKCFEDSTLGCPSLTTELGTAPSPRNLSKARQG